MRRLAWLALFALAVAWVAGFAAILVAAWSAFAQTTDVVEPIPVAAAGSVVGRILAPWMAVAGGLAVLALVLGASLAAGLWSRGARLRALALAGLVLGLVAAHAWSWQAAAEAAALRPRLVAEPALRARFSAAHARSTRGAGTAWMLAVALGLAAGVALARASAPVVSRPGASPPRVG
jgi:hypothetical protein